MSAKKPIRMVKPRGDNQRGLSIPIKAAPAKPTAATAKPAATPQTNAPKSK